MVIFSAISLKSIGQESKFPPPWKELRRDCGTWPRPALTSWKRWGTMDGGQCCKNSPGSAQRKSFSMPMAGIMGHRTKGGKLLSNTHCSDAADELPANSEEAFVAYFPSRLSSPSIDVSVAGSAMGVVPHAGNTGSPPSL